MMRGAEAIVFPVVASIVHPDAVAALVRRAYDVGTVTDCRLVERGLNDTYVLTTSTAKYVARLYRAGWRSQADIAYELELLLHLAANQISVSAPIAAHDGMLTLAVAAPEGVRELALFTYAAGTPLRWMPEHAYPAGRLLSAIHEATQNFRSRHARSSYDLENLVDIPLISMERFLDDRPADLAFLRQFCATLRAIADETLGDAFEWGPCHGDFGANNVHVSGRGVLTVFDFDFCGPGWRMFDLVIFSWGAASRNHRGVWESFLKGYSEIRPIRDSHVAALPLFQALRHLWGLGLRARNATQQGSASLSPAYLDYRIAWFKAWEAQQGRTGPWSDATTTVQSGC